MDDAPARVRREAQAPPDGAWGPAALAAVLEPALAEVAGPGSVCVTLNLEFATQPAADERLVVEAWIERATRTLVFAAAEARAETALVGAASAVFSRG